DLIDARDPDTWRELLRPSTRAIYVETLGNPLLSVPDLEAVVAFAREHGLISIIDNTFATPILYRPLDHGFDLVVHSATKYLNGHSDVLAGVVVGREKPMARVDTHMRLFGGTLDAEGCFLLQRGLRTLALRLEAQCRNAQGLAAFLAAHEAVETVIYPGLESHPDHDRARRLFDGYGAMMAIGIRGGWPAARRFLEGVRLVCHAPSLGGVETLVVSPAKSSHAGIEPRERRRLGIGDGLVRISVGIEARADLEADLARALDC
ncbi:MAG: PLP-dependent transferase, partial [Holophagales bacterium]|nr:PLP-dependent transferase [Holophagales bacterium]